MANVFQVTKGGLFDDKEIYTASGSIYPGRLIKYASGSTVTFCGSGDVPMGFAYGLRSSVYTPTSNEFANGEACSFVWGMGTCLASSDLFMGATLATANQTVYAGDNGQMTTTAGSNKKVGVCEAVDVRITATGGTGGTQSLSRIRFDINPYGT